MSIEMKYVVLKSPAGEQMFVFPAAVNHCDMARAIKSSLVSPRFSAALTAHIHTPISAGFTDGVRCYGRSESLDLDARTGVDAELLACGGAL